MFDQQTAETILDCIADGRSLRSICRDPGMPGRTTVLRWLAENAEFGAKCAHARVLMADAIEEDIADIEDRTISGEIDPAAARAVLASKQWRASKLAPKKYGDKIEHEHKGGVTLTLAPLDERL